MIALALIFAVLIGFMIVILYFWGLNPDQVTVALTSDWSLTQPIPIIIFGAILFGLVVGFIFHLISISTHGISHWRVTRKDRRGKEVISSYREGVARLLSGDLKKAHALLQRALDRDPGRIETYLAMASVYEQEGDVAQAITLLHKAKEIEPSSMEVLFKLAATYEAASRESESAKIYEEILAIEGANRKALRSLRDLKMSQGHWQDALDLQKRVIKAVQGSKRHEEEKRKLLYLRYEVAQQALASGVSDQVRSELESILREDAQFAPSRVSLGDAYVQLGRSEDAARVWKEGYQTLNKCVFLSRLEDLYIKEEDPSTLLSFYRSAITEKPADLMLRLFFGRLCLRLEMVDEALEHLYAVESSGVEFPQLHSLLAEAHRRRKRYDNAIGEYQKALGINAHLHLGFVCDKCGEDSEQWMSRCPSCGSWGTFTLANRSLIEGAKPLEIREIHHGEREEWLEEEE